MVDKRVLFIERSLEIEKLGIMYLAASLERVGVETQVVEYEKEDVCDKMEEFRPDFVCYSVVTGEHKARLELNIELKREFSFLSVWGGSHATFFSTEMLFEQGVDVIVAGEGESAIVDVLTGEFENGIFISGISPNLDWYPFPRRELLYDYAPDLANNKIKNFITMRNCTFNCSYCYNDSYNKMFGINGGNLRRRSVSNVIEEINSVKDKWGLERVLFLDDNFILQPEWVSNFCEVYRKEVDLPFMCSIRADMLAESLLEDMLRAGLYTVNFAIETSNERINRDLLSRRQSLSQTVRTLEILKAAGVSVRMQNMIGLPIPNSLEVALETLKFNRKHTPDFSWISIYQPYPKTRLGRHCIEQGYCDRSVFDKLKNNFFKKSKLNLRHRKRIERLAQWWTWIALKRIPIFLVKVLILFPIPLFLRNLLDRWKIRKARVEVYQNV